MAGTPPSIVTMTTSRQQLVSLEHTPYYHCVSRCVRRAYLCGHDATSGRDFSHRRNWIEARLGELASVFAIDLLAYAVMSNHYHLVIRLNPSLLSDATDEEIVERWRRIFSVPDSFTQDDVERWRERLSSLSWYMRCINEPLARWANREDDCSGRFWEGRFRSQALLDESALVKCMAYVELNPVRAGVADTPESSKHTSFHARAKRRDKHLAPFQDQVNQPADGVSVIPLRSREYLALVDWSGRQLRPGKRGRIAADVPPILDRLGADPTGWTWEMRNYGRWYYRAVGSLAALDRYCRHLGQRWLKGHRNLTAAAG